MEVPNSQDSSDMLVGPISWKKEKLVHACIGLNEIEKVVVPCGSLSW